MIKEIRRNYNDNFTEEKYNAFINWIVDQHNHKPPFKIAETPVFVGQTLKQQLFEACNEICDVLIQPGYSDLVKGAIQPGFEVPNEKEHTIFLQLDFGICKTDNGRLIPQLIEAQGFPSLYFYQHLAAQAYRKFFDIPDGYSHLFNGIKGEEYVEMLKRVILGDVPVENVVLLEIDPDNQATAVDFYATEKALGIKTIGIESVKRADKDLYYLNGEGKKIDIHRIYNRVIFDELVKQPGWRDYEFTMLEDINVEWAGHPNWFFKISKFTLPFLNSQYVPSSHFLSDLDEIPNDLENYVLKPLFSFSGSGVIIDVDQKDIDIIKDKGNYLLQRKVEYANIIETPDSLAKCELRMLMIWEPGEERPKIVNNLARLSKGAMIGVRYNKGKSWVGGSVGFFET